MLLRVTERPVVPPLPSAFPTFADCAGTFGWRPHLICARYSFAVAWALRVEILLASPIVTLIEDARFLCCLRSPCTVNVFFLFPTTTKKPLLCVARQIPTFSWRGQAQSPCRRAEPECQALRLRKVKTVFQTVLVG
jgi:hypothetical protein